jgi:hypothetical protein
MTPKTLSICFLLVFFVAAERDSSTTTTTTSSQAGILSSPSSTPGDKVFVGTFVKNPSISSPFEDEGPNDNKTPSPSLKRIYEFNSIRSQSKLLSMSFSLLSIIRHSHQSNILQ